MTTFDPAADRPREPFQPSADPDVFFETPAISAVVRRLIASLDHGEPPLAVLTGPPGTGKTTVLRRISVELARAGWRTAIEGLPLELDDLRNHLPVAEPGRRVVVGLDEAQALSSDLLAALDPILVLRPDLRILLVGEPALEAKLDGLRLGGAAVRGAVRCRLAALGAEAVHGYVDFRWRTVRGGACPFAPEAVERIAAVSDGIPQMINLLCGLALHLAEVRGLDRVTADLVGEAEGELPRPAPRHRVRQGRRSSGVPVSRLMRAAVVAAVVIPSLVVAGGFLLRRGAHGPESRVPAAPIGLASQITVEPVQVASLASEPSSADFTSDAGHEPARRPLPLEAIAAETPADARATPAPDLPLPSRRPAVDRARARSATREVAATTPTLPPMPPRAVPIPAAAPAARREPGKDDALLRRAEYGDLTAVQALLGEGASPEARDAAGFTPLMLAVIHGHSAIVDSLIAGGGRVNVQNRAGLTPLMLAAINDHAVVLRVLIDHGADMNARTHAGWTALTYAAWRGHPEIVRVLLARGADPNVTDREGWTILRYANWRAAEPIASDDLPEPPANAGRPTPPGPGHAEVVVLLRKAGVRR